MITNAFIVMPERDSVTGAVADFSNMSVKLLSQTFPGLGIDYANLVLIFGNTQSGSWVSQEVVVGAYQGAWTIQNGVATPGADTPERTISNIDLSAFAVNADESVQISLKVVNRVNGVDTLIVARESATNARWISGTKDLPPIINSSISQTLLNNNANLKFAIDFDHMDFYHVAGGHVNQTAFNGAHGGEIDPDNGGWWWGDEYHGQVDNPGFEVEVEINGVTTYLGRVDDQGVAIGDPAPISISMFPGTFNGTNFYHEGSTLNAYMATPATAQAATVKVTPVYEMNLNDGSLGSVLIKSTSNTVSFPLTTLFDPNAISITDVTLDQANNEISITTSGELVDLFPNSSLNSWDMRFYERVDTHLDSSYVTGNFDVVHMGANQATLFSSATNNGDGTFTYTLGYNFPSTFTSVPNPPGCGYDRTIKVELRLSGSPFITVSSFEMPSSTAVSCYSDADADVRDKLWFPDFIQTSVQGLTGLQSRVTYQVYALLDGSFRIQWIDWDDTWTSNASGTPTIQGLDLPYDGEWVAKIERKVYQADDPDDVNNTSWTLLQDTLEIANQPFTDYTGGYVEGNIIARWQAAKEFLRYYIDTDKSYLNLVDHTSDGDGADNEKIKHEYLLILGVRFPTVGGYDYVWQNETPSEITDFTSSWAGSGVPRIRGKWYNVGGLNFPYVDDLTVTRVDPTGYDFPMVELNWSWTAPSQNVFDQSGNMKWNIKGNVTETDISTALDFDSDALGRDRIAAKQDWEWFRTFQHPECQGNGCNNDLKSTTIEPDFNNGWGNSKADLNTILAVAQGDVWIRIDANNPLRRLYTVRLVPFGWDNNTFAFWGEPGYGSPINFSTEFAVTLWNPEIDGMTQNEQLSHSHHVLVAQDNGYTRKITFNDLLDLSSLKTSDEKKGVMNIYARRNLEHNFLDNKIKAAPFSVRRKSARIRGGNYENMKIINPAIIP